MHVLNEAELLDDSAIADATTAPRRSATALIIIVTGRLMKAA